METEKFWYLKHTNIFAGMTDVDFGDLNRIADMVSYNRHEQVRGRNDSDDVIYLIKEGRVKIYKPLPEEKELTLAVLEPGEIFGETAMFEEEPHGTIAETLDDTLLCVIRRRDFGILLRKKPELAMRAAIMVGVKRRLIENRLENLVFRSVSSRLALLLNSLAEKNGIRESRGITLSVKLSEPKLARLTATPRETTSPLLNEIERLGHIEIRRRRIKILNQWALKKIADDRMRELSIPEDPEPTDDFAGL